MTLASTVVAATFFHVHRSVRRRYVRLWGLAYLAALPCLAFTWRVLERPNYLDSVLSQLFVFANATLMVAGCHEFVGRQMPWRRLGWSHPQDVLQHLTTRLAEDPVGDRRRHWVTLSPALPALMRHTPDGLLALLSAAPPQQWAPLRPILEVSRT